MKNKLLLKKLFYKILRIRLIEKTISHRYHEQEMRCPVHLSIGQESIAVGVCENLKSYDEVVTAHRSHAHYLAKGGDLNSMISELHGKITGCAGGKGGSMHLIDLKSNVVAAVPIVGSTIPIGVGKAWANKLNNSNKVVVIFFGDGATEEGVFFESLDFASFKGLKILFVCENNKYSVYSHISKRQSSKRNLIAIVKNMGIKSFSLKDHDLQKIYNKTDEALNYIRKFSRPFFLNINTYRLVEHCGPNNDDDINYRSTKEINYWKKNCQINKTEKYLVKNKILNYKNISSIKNKIRNEIDKSFVFAKKSPFPKKKDLKKNLFKKEL